MENTNQYFIALDTSFDEHDYEFDYSGSRYFQAYDGCSSVYDDETDEDEEDDQDADIDNQQQFYYYPEENYRQLMYYCNNALPASMCMCTAYNDQFTAAQSWQHCHCRGLEIYSNTLAFFPTIMSNNPNTDIVESSSFYFDKGTMTSASDFEMNLQRAAFDDEESTEVSDAISTDSSENMESNAVFNSASNMVSSDASDNTVSAEVSYAVSNAISYAVYPNATFDNTVTHEISTDASNDMESNAVFVAAFADAFDRIESADESYTVAPDEKYDNAVSAVTYESSLGTSDDTESNNAVCHTILINETPDESMDECCMDYQRSITESSKDEDWMSDECSSRVSQCEDDNAAKMNELESDVRDGVAALTKETQSSLTFDGSRKRKPASHNSCSSADFSMIRCKKLRMDHIEGGGNYGQTDSAEGLLAGGKLAADKHPVSTHGVLENDLVPIQRSSIIRNYGPILVSAAIALFFQ